MYNIYINSTGKPNKGNFNVDFNKQPLFFEEGSKIAMNNLLIYNSIDNISDEGVLNNNVIYILCYPTRNSKEYSGYISTPDAYQNYFPVHLPVTNLIDPTTDIEGFVACTNVDQFKDRPFYGNIRVKNYYGSGPEPHKRVYKITFENGVYDPYAIDQYIAERLGIDIEGDILHNVKSAEDRHFIISDDETYGKIKVDIKKWFNSGLDTPDTRQYMYDIVFPKSKYTLEDLNSKNCISKLLGIYHDDMKTLTLSGDEYWSFNATREVHTSRDNPYAFNRGDFNNGILGLEIRVRPGIFDGGYDALSHDSDVIAGFNLTASVGDSQAMAPENLTWLDVTQTNRYINNVQIVITDQDGVERGKNIREDISLTLSVKTPDDKKIVY